MYMVLLVILICLFSIFWGLLTQKNAYNPLVLFNGFMGLITLLASLQLFGINKPSENTLFVTAIGTFSFLLGTMLMDLIPKKKLINRTFRLDKKILKLCIILMVLYSVYRILGVAPLLLKGYPLDYIRMVYFGNEVDGVSSSQLLSIIEIYINLPLIYAITPIMIVFTINKKEELDKVTILFYVIWISLSTVVSGGRIILYIIAVEFIVCFFILKSNFKISRSTKRNIIFSLIASIIFMYYMSVNRRIGDEAYNFIETLYANFSGSMAHMSYRFDTIKFEEHYTYGFTLISGILRPIMLVWKYILGSYPDIYQNTLNIGVQLQSAVDIGNNTSFNAYATPFFYFYYDCGYIGVFIDSIVYGGVCQLIYLKMKRNSSEINIAMYLLIIHGIFTSMIRYSFILVYYSFAFIYIRLLFRQKPK